MTDSAQLLLLPLPLQMYINAKKGRDLSCSRSTLSPFKTAAVQPDRVSLKAPIQKYSCICL